MRDEMGDETIWRRFRRKAAARGRAPRQPAPKLGTKEVEALADALNHSAERVQTLWFSFLTFMLYLAIATGTTTHRMLFLESPLNLPVLNIALPLLGFYILTPVIFVVLHFYMLLNLVLLARTAKSFEDSLARAIPEDGEARENFRMRIENTLFVQLLVGGRLEREGLNARLLSLMALITLALAPVVLLLYVQIKFLPYHSEWITWLHRGLLALDLALVWTLWPGYRSGWGVRLWPKRSWWLVVPGIGSAAALAYAVLVATFPDERMYLATSLNSGLERHWYLSLSHTTNRDRKPDWYDSYAPPNTLDLHGEDLIDDAKLARIIEKNESSTDAHRWVATLSLKKRDLTGANLEGADVRHVDFSHAILNRANLDNAWAEKAHLDDNAQLRGATLDNAQLQGSSLEHAQLQDATLNSTRLQGASLGEAQLEGASLYGAELQGADLKGAQLLDSRKLDYATLQGASLDRTELQGVFLDGAWLQGASLHGAALQGARLHEARLQGASLHEAQLQGADLSGAQLQGANLTDAQLQGASLDFARLQGVSLDHAQLQGASFIRVCIWRADARLAAWNNTMIEPPTADDIHRCDWTAGSFLNLKHQLPGGNDKSDTIKRIEQRLDPAKALEGEEEMAKVWVARERESPTPEAYEKSLARLWRAVGCAAGGAPYVIGGLLDHLEGSEKNVDSPFSAQSPQTHELAAAFLDEEHCPGAHGLSGDGKAKLKAIRGRSPPPSSNQ